MTVRIPREHYEAMVAHCIDGRPNEACGALAADGDTIVKVFPMTNVEASPVRYRFDPREQMAVEAEIDGRGWTWIGGFHSHTRTEAYPSPTDVARAIGDMLYVIVSLAEDEAEVRAFRIAKAHFEDLEGEVEEVPVEVVG